MKYLLMREQVFQLSLDGRQPNRRSKAYLLGEEGSKTGVLATRKRGLFSSVSAVRFEKTVNRAVLCRRTVQASANQALLSGTAPPQAAGGNYSSQSGQCPGTFDIGAA